MWEMKLSDGTKRVFSIYKSLSYNEQKCFICGEYLKQLEKVYFIIPPSKYKSQYKKLSNNLIVHCEEWDAFCLGVNDDIELLDKIKKHKIPKSIAFTEEEFNRLKCFKKACWDFDLKQEFEKPYGIKMKRSGSSLNITYNVYSDSIKIDYRGKKNLFDSFYLRQISTNVYNKMHEYIGDGKKDDYSASNEIKNVFDKVNKMIR